MIKTLFNRRDIFEVSFIFQVNVGKNVEIKAYFKLMDCKECCSQIKKMEQKFILDKKIK